MMDLINVTLIRAKNAFDSFMKEEKGAVDFSCNRCFDCNRSGISSVI